MADIDEVMQNLNAEHWGRVFWTSDLHFGHRNIMKYCARPWWVGGEEITDTEVRAMNEGIIARWNAIVPEDGIVFVLGDVAMGKFPDSLENVKRLNGRKVLIPGNHDRCWLGTLRDPAVWTEKYHKARDLYESVGFHIRTSTVTMNVDGFDVVISHFPYEGDSHEEDRYVEWRPKDKGLPLLHGHVHDKWKTNGRQFNVGVDVHDYFPVPTSTIVEWLRSL